MEAAKRYFTGLRVDEIHACKPIYKVFMICEQTQPMQLTHLDEVCEAQMIEPIRSILASCFQRIVEFNHTFGRNYTEMNGYLWPQPRMS